MRSLSGFRYKACKRKTFARSFSNRKVKLQTMNNTRRRLLPYVLLLIALAVSPVRAQTTQSMTAADPLMMLPASDVVMIIDHSRIWNEAIPRFFGKDTPPLSKIMAETEKFKAKTGIDVRSISRIAIGVRFVNPEAVTKNIDKKDMAVVIIAQGDFDPGTLVAAMRRDAKERVKEEQYGGQTIYWVEEPPKGNTPRPDIEKISVAVLDANTVAIGDLVHVRATVDAKAGNGRLSPGLVSLAQRNSTALVSLAANVPPTLAASITPKSTPSGNAEMDKNFGKFFEAVASIKQMYLSLGMTATDIEASLGARLGSTEQAQALGDMLLGARQQYSVFIEDKMIRDLVANMQITAESDEVQLKAALPQTTIAMLLSNANKTATTAATAATPKTTVTQAATPAAQPSKKKRRSTRRRKG